MKQGGKKMKKNCVTAEIYVIQSRLFRFEVLKVKMSKKLK